MASGSEALVVDASLDPDIYVDAATARGCMIAHVLDTHIHADHLSRARALADRTGAQLLLPAQHRVTFSHRPLVEGTEIRFGSAMLRALHTPGHTFESMCYLVNERWLLTGDTLFLASVGRPDLEASAEQAQARSLLLHDSLRRLLQLDERLLVLPGHTSTPVAFDQALVGTTLAKVRDAVRIPESAETFVNHILSRIPATPPNHSAIVGFNESGGLPAGDPTDLEAGPNRCAVS